jgi:hypothetical protein
LDVNIEQITRIRADYADWGKSFEGKSDSAGDLESPAEVMLLHDELSKIAILSNGLF